MPTEKRLLKVFLCHASQDKPVVRELYQRLLAEGWIDPWLDKEKLLPGQEWELEIEKSVEAADVVIVCLSKSSVEKEGYFQKEIRKVLDLSEQKPEGTIFIIPLRLEDCKPPRRLAKWQYVDYFPEENRDEAYTHLLQSLKSRGRSLGLEFKDILSKAESVLIESGFEQVMISSKQPAKDSSVNPKKTIVQSHRYDHHTALASEKLGQASGSGVNFVSTKLRWGNEDLGYSLHAEPNSYTYSGMQTTDFLDYLGFKKETCTFVNQKVCYSAWIDEAFDLSNFAEGFGEAFVLFEESAKLFDRCGHFLNQPEGWAYFNPNTVTRAPRTKSVMGGDGHNADKSEIMKQLEDDDFSYRLSWIERIHTKGWVFHYQPRGTYSHEIQSVLKFLGLSDFGECPFFGFERCYWIFFEYQNRPDDLFESNADFVHSYFASHPKNFSLAVRNFIRANNLVSQYGFYFLTK